MPRLSSWWASSNSSKRHGSILVKEVTAGEDVQKIGFTVPSLPPQLVIVKNVIAGSWAAKQKVVPGDVLISVNGINVTEMTADEFKAYMQGRPLDLSFIVNPLRNKVKSVTLNLKATESEDEEEEEKEDDAPDSNEECEAEKPQEPTKPQWVRSNSWQQDSRNSTASSSSKSILKSHADANVENKGRNSVKLQHDERDSIMSRWIDRDNVVAHSNERNEKSDNASPKRAMMTSEKKNRIDHESRKATDQSTQETEIEPSKPSSHETKHVESEDTTEVFQPSSEKARRGQAAAEESEDTSEVALQSAEKVRDAQPPKDSEDTDESKSKRRHHPSFDRSSEASVHAKSEDFSENTAEGEADDDVSDDFGEEDVNKDNFQFRPARRPNGGRRQSVSDWWESDNADVAKVHSNGERRGSLSDWFLDGEQQLDTGTNLTAVHRMSITADDLTAEQKAATELAASLQEAVMGDDVEALMRVITRAEGKGIISVLLEDAKKRLRFLQKKLTNAEDKATF